jgi:SRSO17 transposase
VPTPRPIASNHRLVSKASISNLICEPYGDRRPMEFSLLGWAQARSRILHRYVQQAQYQIGARHFEGLSWAGNQSYHHATVNVFECPSITVDFGRCGPCFAIC